jgi:hypothetical protein
VAAGAVANSFHGHDVRVTADWDVARLSSDEWETLRDARLRGLLEDPDSFGSSWYEEQDGDE